MGCGGLGWCTGSRRARGWGADVAEMVGGASWRVGAGVKKQKMGRTPMSILGLKMRHDRLEKERETAVKPAPRRMTITRADIERDDFTAGCWGCRARLTERSRQGHADECRRRLEKDMKNEPKMRKPREPENDWRRDRRGTRDHRAQRESSDNIDGDEFRPHDGFKFYLAGGCGRRVAEGGGHA